ncbi:MAG: radical SAM protein [Candidatus Omnitrophica bacterium]|nr:radical SAM protein [Candidatus Omnitrophota bacterium]
MIIRRERIARFKRYIIDCLRHATLKKVFNLIRVECKLAGNVPNLKNIYPYFFIVEISNACNLRCPLCLMGQRKIIPRKNLMSIERYMSLMDPIKDYIFLVSLYNWGEPFLNQDIYKIIQFNTSHNIGTVVNSNFNAPVDGERLVRSGLAHLVISGDGITQAVYEKYRVGGKIDLVLDNLRKVVNAKKKYGSRLPHVEWQCLVTKWNETQLDDIKKKVLDLGVDEVRFSNINFYSAENRQEAEAEWLPQNPIYRAFALKPVSSSKAFRKPCFWLWRTAVVNVNGGMAPCCLFDVPDWGNLFDEEFLSVWNGKRYIEARKFSRNNRNTRKAGLICDNCYEPLV